jgi:hypothetical protein
MQEVDEKRAVSSDTSAAEETAAKTGQRNHFTPAERSEMHAADRHAAAAVAGLMATIFTAGLVGYLLIAFIVFSD